MILASARKKVYYDRFSLRRTVFSAKLTYIPHVLNELVLGFLPDRNQTTAERFSGKWISIIIEKKLKFQLTFAKGRKNVRKRRGQFYLISYNSWTEWDIFTKLRIHVYNIVFWSNKKNCPDSPLGGAISLEKL